MSRAARILLAFMAVAVSVGLAFRPDSAHSADASTRNAASQGEETVTIEAQRRKKLQHQVDHFVSGVIVRYLNNSLERWDTPVCPLVAGLPEDRGDFILARLSQIARASHVPLAGEHCRSPNLFVVATDDPDLLARQWWKRERAAFNTCNGLGYVKDFMRARGPVRVYYNAEFRSGDGTRLSSDAAYLNLRGLTLGFTLSPCVGMGGTGTRIGHGAVQALSSVIVLVDSNRTVDINIGQLADYLAMVGFAQIRPDADTGTVPTILRLFQRADQPPQGLTSWDEAFLHSLYTTDQNSVLQLAAIKAGILEQVGH